MIEHKPNTSHLQIPCFFIYLETDFLYSGGSLTRPPRKPAAEREQLDPRWGARLMVTSATASHPPLPHLADIIEPLYCQYGSLGFRTKKSNRYGSLFPLAADGNKMEKMCEINIGYKLIEQ